jgi:hypothetical protein
MVPLIISYRKLDAAFVADFDTFVVSGNSGGEKTLKGNSFVTVSCVVISLSSRRTKYDPGRFGVNGCENLGVKGS